MRRALVVVAHPDDEVLACGGSIAKWSSAGVEVGVLFMADGESSRQRQTSSAEWIRRRREESARAAEYLGHRVIGFCDYPDNQMDTIPLLEIIQKVEVVVSEFGPDTVITHFAGDLNVDHQVVARSVQTAVRPIPGSPVQLVLSAEVASSTEWAASGGSFGPNLFVDISDFIDVKLRALSAYESEVRPAPHPRSLAAVTALAQWRGSTGGCPAAEGFALIRQII